MASAASVSLAFGVLPSLCFKESSHIRTQLFVSCPKLPSLLLQRVPVSHSLVVFSRRRKNDSARRRSSKNKKLMQTDYEGEDDIDEDAFEALFSQLEEDLKNDDLTTGDSDDEITEADLARLDQELEEALGDVDNDKLSESLPSNTYTSESDDDERRWPDLKKWQIRRLAYALKIGRRKTSIKRLAAELGLDRALVLELLRDPPPNLLLISASLPDEVVLTPLHESRHLELESSSVPVDVPKPYPEVKSPVHVMQNRWSAQKRLKKVQLETLERVYSCTKRPTNAMISNIVHVTNLPRKRVVKWFEDKRHEDGVPEQRQPYHQSVPHCSPELII